MELKHDHKLSGYDRSVTEEGSTVESPDHIASLIHCMNIF